MRTAVARPIVGKRGSLLPNPGRSRESSTRSSPSFCTCNLQRGLLLLGFLYFQISTFALVQWVREHSSSSDLMHSGSVAVKPGNEAAMRSVPGAVGESPPSPLSSPLSPSSSPPPRVRPLALPAP